MPDQVQNWEAYFDPTIRLWHRRALPRDCWAIDLDLVGACKVCRQPLYLIEATRNPDKATSVLERFATMCDVPALIVWHDDNGPTHARSLFPFEFKMNCEDDIVRYLSEIREYHKSKCLGQPW